MATIKQTNEELKIELQERGYYVNEIKKGSSVEYLVITTEPPNDSIPIDHNANLGCPLITIPVCI